jgi:HK97 family phage major capsid protein
MTMEYIERQVELRAKAWEEAKALLDSAAAENRDLSGEEQVKYDRIMEDLDSRAKTIEAIQKDAERESRVNAAIAGFEDVARPVVERPTAPNDADLIRSLARGEVRTANFEKRTITGGSTGAPVPTSFYDQVIMRARLVGPMLDLSTVLNTQGGENLQIPSLNTYSVGTVSAQGAEIGPSDPAFNNFVTLGAFKYSFLTQISRELIEDSGVDILAFLADQTGNALGFSVNNALTVGTGTVEPNGLMTKTTAGVTGGTGVTGAFTGDNLIDLLYSLDGAARRLPGFGFMMNGASIGKTRKLKDSQGQYLFQPSLALGTPDTLLGYPLYENPAIVDTGVNAKSVAAGHFPSYFVRQVGGIRLDRSDDFAFSNDLVTFRATIRLDGNLPQTSHIKHFAGGTA